MSWARKISRARALSFAEWRVLVRAIALLWTTAALLRWRSLPQMLAWIEPKSNARTNAKTNANTNESSQRSSHSPNGTTLPAARISELVAAATNLLMPAGSCLPKALVTYRILRQHGFDSSVVIGTNQPGLRHETFQAHAWVELSNGSSKKSFGERGATEYEPLVRFKKSA